MRRLPCVLSVLVAFASFGCSSSAPTAPAAVKDPAVDVSSLVAFGAPPAAAGLRASAVIDGFRVHPDPGDDGVVAVPQGESVVVNATDIAVAGSHLTVSWGDDSHVQRVGCGPCRADHVYAEGRYTVEASVDDVRASSDARASASRSISFVVRVIPQRERPKARFGAAFGWFPNDINVGDTTEARIPISPPPGVTINFPIFFQCGSVGVLTFLPFPPPLPPPGPPFPPPPSFISFPFRGAAPGSCELILDGSDADGPFTEVSDVNVH